MFQLAEYIGRHIKQLLVRKDDDWLFRCGLQGFGTLNRFLLFDRYHRERVYYISARVLKDAASV